MKQTTVAMVAFLFLFSVMAGPVSAAGTVKETADFKITVPAGWEFNDFGNGAVQIYNKSGSYMIELKKAGLNMTEKDVQVGMANLVKQYKGSAPEEVNMLGLNFLKTTFDRSSTHQTLYAALKDGVKISITLVGAKHETDPTIQDAFKSIVLK